MRLLCTIGSLHILKPRMVLKRGDEFEIDGLKGSSLIAQGYAVQIPDVPAEAPVKKSPPKKKG